jgi:CRP-like cAMP-binding protein
MMRRAKAVISAGSIFKGPTIRAVDPWISGNQATSKLRQLLGDDERRRLAAIASVVRFKKSAKIYHQGNRADAVFNIVSGVVKAHNTHPGGEQIAAFLFPDDLFGLSEQGRYANSATAITPVTAYAIPVSALRSELAHDPALEFHVICKLCLELRQAQRHAFLLSRRHALSRLALFLQLLEQLQASRGDTTSEIYLPMSRSDIGEYAGMSLEAVSRAFRILTKRGVLKILNRRHVKIANRDAFEKIAADPNGSLGLGSTVQ